MWCPGFLMTFPLDAISAELNRVFASVHMSEPVSSTPAIPPGRAWSSNERERVPRNPRPHHRWGQSRPAFAAERTQNHSASSAQWNTFEEVVDNEDEDNDGSDTIDIRVIYKNTCEMNSWCWPLAWTMVKMMPDSKCGQFTVGNSMRETC